jgi:uncharacterized protein YraI
MLQSVWAMLSVCKFVRLVMLAMVVLPAASLGLAFSAPPALAASAFTTTDLNLRAGPGTNHYVKLVMPPSASVELLSGLGRSGFYKVAYAGETGYASAQFLSIGGSADSGSSVDAGWDNAGSARTTSALNLRYGPGITYDIASIMPFGATVTLTGASDSGFLGVIYNGNNGWASADYITEESPTQSNDGNGGGTLYTTSDLNLRSGPSVNNRILLVMPWAAAVTLGGSSSNGFTEVTYNGTSGWASLSYLSQDKPTTTVTDGGNQSTGNDVVSIIYAAAAMYGQNGDAMLAVASCESVLDPNATNSSSGAAGLFQFLPSTWVTTPYGGYNIYDPVANAQAAAWMWSVGRRGEWVC